MIEQGDQTLGLLRKLGHTVGPWKQEKSSIVSAKEQYTTKCTNRYCEGNFLYCKETSENLEYIVNYVWYLWNLDLIQYTVDNSLRMSCLVMSHSPELTNVGKRMHRDLVIVDSGNIMNASGILINNVCQRLRNFF